MKYVLNTVIAICLISLIGCKPRMDNGESNLATTQANGLSIFAGSYVQLDEDGQPDTEVAARIKVIGQKITFSTFGYEDAGVVFEEAVNGKEDVEKFTVSSTSMGGLTSHITKRIVTVVKRSGNTVSKVVKMYSRPFGYVLSEYKLFKTMSYTLKLDGDKLIYKTLSADVLRKETKIFNFLKNEA